MGVSTVGDLGQVQLTVGLLDPSVGNGAGSLAKLKQYGIGRDVDSSSCYGGFQKVGSPFLPSRVSLSSIYLISRHGGRSI